jgi:hypothetical protein
MATPKAIRASPAGQMPSPTGENWEHRQEVEASQLSEFEEMEAALLHEQRVAPAHAAAAAETSPHVRPTHRPPNRSTTHVVRDDGGLTTRRAMARTEMLTAAHVSFTTPCSCEVAANPRRVGRGTVKPFTPASE